jgi:hypothetical protein
MRESAAVTQAPPRAIEGEPRHENPVDRLGLDPFAVIARLRDAAPSRCHVDAEIGDRMQVEHARGSIDTRDRYRLPLL